MGQVLLQGKEPLKKTTTTIALSIISICYDNTVLSRPRNTTLQQTQAGPGTQAIRHDVNKLSGCKNAKWNAIEMWEQCWSECGPPRFVTWRGCRGSIPTRKQINDIHCWQIFSGPSQCMVPVWCSRPPLCIVWERIPVDSHWALIAWWSLLAPMETTTLKLLLFLNSAALVRTGCQAAASVIPPRLFGFVYISHVSFLWCRIILWCF